MFEEKKDNLPNDEWGYEADQNWDGFWDLLLKEDMRQNPQLYKKPNEEKI